MPPAGENGAAGRAASPDGGRAAMERGYARSRARTDEVRARLQPLAPGERPLVVTIAAILAALIAVANLALFLAGWEVRGEDPSTSGTLIFCAVMGAAAVGMWKRKYWAVLGFEMLLGVAIVGTALALLRASNLAAVALCVGIFAVCGPLFWFLIRAMARLQMPSRTR
jgi:hypothetical protein